MPPFQFQPYEPRYAGTIGDLMQAPARARAQALRESAAAQARAAEIGGQASAGAATNINNAVAGSLGTYMQRKEQAPARAAQALDLEAKRLAVDQAKRETDEEQQLRTLFAKNPEPKPDEIYGIVGPKRGTDIVKGIAALRQENQKTFKSTQELVGSMTGAVLALPEGMRADAYTTARQNLVQRGVVQPQDIPEQYDPAFLQQAHVWALTPDKQQDVLNPKPIEVSPNATLVAPGTDGKIGPVYTAPAAPEKAPTAGSFEDYVRRYAADKGIAVAGLKPKDIQDARKLYQQADDRPSVSVQLQNAQNNLPGDWDKQGDAFLDSIPKQWRTTVKKIAGYDEDPTKVASMRGGMRETLMQWVNQVNPGYDQAQFAIRNPTKKAFTTGTQGQQITAMNTAVEHLDMLQAAADALANGSFKPGNAVYNYLRDQFGSAMPSNYQTIKQLVDKEVEAVANKGVPTVSGTAEQKALAGTAASPQAIKGYIDTLIPLMGSKLNALHYQYQQAMGADDPWKPLTPQSEAVLAKRGISIGAAHGSTPDATAAGRPLRQEIPGHPGKFAVSKDGGKTWKAE